tara:strand:- start:1537 stop:2619 length:1083 start_codon:yes stop_codon:yes gene_type:complete
MARNILKSSNTAIATQGNFGAFSTGSLPLVLYGTVQNADYSVEFGRQNLKQIGSQNLAGDTFFRQPNVNLNISYIPEPRFFNETQGGFLSVNPTVRFVNMFSGDLESSTNFYFLNTPDQEDDAFNTITIGGSPIDLAGFDTIAFGNCFPTSYSLQYSVGQLPTVSTSYLCSNVIVELLTGSTMNLPSINLESGNNRNVGMCSFEFTSGIKDPRIVNPNSAGSSITLENLQVGGQNLSGTHFIQSVNMAVSLDRVSDYGLGSDFAYGRKAQMPANGSFSVSSLVSGLDAGLLSGVLYNDSSYQFELVLDSNGTKMIYQIQDAHLDSFNYSMPVNGFMSYNASFSFPITEERGLSVSGMYYS